MNQDDCPLKRTPVAIAEGRLNARENGSIRFTEGFFRANESANGFNLSPGQMPDRS